MGEVIQFVNATRTCIQCEGPIPHGRGGKRNRSRVKYCSPNCSRVASYHRQDLEKRQEYNKRSNDRRMEKDLLPYLRNLQRTKGDLSGTSAAARHFALKVILIEAMGNWRLRTALGFERAREALIELAGDADTLDEIEMSLTETAMSTQVELRGEGI